MGKTREEITSADTKSAGFDYQHYYALYQLLTIQPDDTLGIEIKDDVHIQKADGTLILIQLKHTIQKKANQDTINLSTRDFDLWHTISNWIDLIKDTNAGRSKIKDQIDFLNNTTFILVSNKSFDQNNAFLKSLEDFKIGISSHNDFINHLDELYKETHDTTIKSYINKLQSLPKKVGQCFLKRIDTVLNEDKIIDKIQYYIANQYGCDEVDAEQILFYLEGRLRIDKFVKIKKGEKYSFLKKDFVKKYLVPAYTRIRKLEFPFFEKKRAQSPQVLDSIFAKQLKLVKYTDEYIYNCDYLRQLCLYNLKIWSERKGLISKNDCDAFFLSAVKKWEPIHRSCHKQSNQCTNDDKLENAKDTYLQCMSIDLHINSVIMDHRISNGTFLELSNKPQIGWTHNWDTTFE